MYATVNECIFLEQYIHYVLCATIVNGFSGRCSLCETIIKEVASWQCGFRISVFHDFVITSIMQIMHLFILQSKCKSDNYFNQKRHDKNEHFKFELLYFIIYLFIYIL